MQTGLGVALIGLGMVSKTYVAALHDLAGSVNLVGVLGSRADSAAEFVTRHGLSQATTYGSLDQLVADPAVDFAIVATPPNARADIVRALCAAQKPILMEKPVERDLARATALVEQCETARVPLGIVLQHRARPVIAGLRKLLAGGELGELCAVELTVPWWRPQAYYDAAGRGSYARDGGGVMISQAIHAIDLMLSLTGPVTDVTAMTATTQLHHMEAEDFVSAGLRFANGAVGTLFATTAGFPGRVETLTLHYAKATARLETNALHISWHDGREQTLGASAASGAGADPMAFTHEWHRAVIADFADAIITRRPPMVSGREALAVHRLIAAMEISGQSGGRTLVEQDA
jgi:predicted dehydrogenase